jgi:SAM-dependent methyltransferase
VIQGSEQAVNTSVPSLARAYDHLLGGRANFAADRALARQWRERYPRAGELLSLSRTYVTTCCARLSAEGIRQFIDVGSGLPTAPSLHAAVRPGTAQVVYVDRDPGVVAHARTLAPARSVSVLTGDLLEPEALLWALRSLVDLAQPACLVLALVIQALPDLGTARAVVDVLVRALAPGSHVVLTAGGGAAGRLPDTVAGADMSTADVAAFLAGLDMLPPGLEEGLLLRGTGRKPGNGGRG